MRKILLAFCTFIVCHCLAQENNPLINSGELINDGLKLHDEGKYKEAIQLYKKISESDTNYYRGLYELSLSLYADSQFNESLRYCELGLKKPNDYQHLFLVQYGSVLDDLGENDRALKIYDSAHQQYPALATVYVNKATTLLRLKKYAEAEKILQECLIMDPYASSAHFKLGLAALNQGKLVESFLSFMQYLVNAPEGPHARRSVLLLNAISNYTDDVREIMEARQIQANENYALTEQIIMSKISLDKNYKLKIKLEDPITRQIQVLLEKQNFNEAAPDFWMQYYLPLYKEIYNTDRLDDLVFTMFAGLDIKEVQDYLKKNKKKHDQFVDYCVKYLNSIRSTRELNYKDRIAAASLYYHDGLKLDGKGLRKGDNYVGKWEFYFPEGSLKSSGNFNDNGNKEGLWRYYYVNGQLKGEEIYKDGKQTGDETYYFDNGVVSRRATYANGELEGELKLYYYLGNIKSIEQYKNGKQEGTARQYYSSGSLQAVVQYKAGEADGPYTLYFKNGRKQVEGVYAAGKINGRAKYYFETGGLSSEAEYVNDQRTGTWKFYHENGQLKSTEIYKDGAVEGKYVEYHENGKLFYEEDIKKGKADGDVKYFDDDGVLYTIFTFDKGITKKAKYFDKKGNVIGSSEMSNRKLDLTSYYADGTKKMRCSYNEKGDQEGTETYYYGSGTKSAENQYAGGVLDGKASSFFTNGKVNAEVLYKGGKKNGYYKEYHKHGMLAGEGWYLEDQQQGQWLFYDELGKIKVKNNYSDDVMHGVKESFYPNGKLEYSETYYYGSLTELKQFDSTGKLINNFKIQNGKGKYLLKYITGGKYAEGTMENGELNGPLQYYFFDGVPFIKQFMNQGESDSTYISYFHNGKISSQGKYDFGNKTGLWKYYVTTGELLYTEEYKLGKVDGKRIYYYRNGKVETEILFTGGNRNGWLSKYDDDGSLMYKMLYDNDVPIAFTYPDKNNNLVPEIPLKHGNGKVVAYYANGKMSTEFTLVDGDLNGPDKTYFSNGNLRSESNEVFNQTEGVMKNYHRNGKLKESFNYLHNNFHGEYKEYNEAGILITEGNYYNDLKHGEWKDYDEKGKLKEVSVYYYGKLINIKK